MKFDSSIEENHDTYDIAVKRFSRFLENKGCRPSTIEGYSRFKRICLKFCNTTTPNKKKLEEFRVSLFNEHLARSTINNFSFAIMRYQEMLGVPVTFPILKRNEALPYFFIEEVLSIFASIHNLRHLAMQNNSLLGVPKEQRIMQFG